VSDVTVPVPERVSLISVVSCERREALSLFVSHRLEKPMHG
jgi:hypothetical protein